MQISHLENRYAELRQALDAGQLSIDEFQTAVDELRTQDDYGRYWMIGAETGVWYYYDGVEWVQADPHEASSLPFVDENNVYWMLGKETNQWYYYDGENWINPEAQPEAQAAQDSTQYYQDDQSRYWAKGADSGEWYFYDEAGWHRAEEISPPPAAPTYAPPPPAPSATPFAPIQPTPDYLQTPQPQPTQQPPVQPQPAPQSQQPAPVQPQPQLQPQQPAPQPQPMDASLEPGVWFYFDGEQWLRYQDPAADMPAEEKDPLPAEEPEAGMWYYFDGEQWLQYYEDPSANLEFDEEAEEEDYSEEEESADESYEDDDEGMEDDETVIEIEDLDDYIEIIEVDEADVIDPEEDLVEAEFEVEIFTPRDVAVAATTPVSPVTEAPPAEPSAPSEAADVPARARPGTKQVPVTPGKRPSTAVKPVPQTGGPALLKTLPSWIWTALGGLATLIVVLFIIVGIVYLLNNRERAVSLLEAQLTPTLPAAVAQTTPTPVATPSPTATPPPTPTSIPLTNFTSSYFGFSIDYPAGWVFKEDDDLVIFSPSARALDRTAVNGASLWILQTSQTDITMSLADGLARFDPINETLNEGIMNIGRQTWTSAQISYTSPEMGADAIALVASTIVNGNNYTLLAVAPAAEWESYKPLFQYAIDSFQFTGQQSAAAPAQGTTGPTAQASTTPQPTTTASPTPIKASTTSAYVVQSGDTLGGIAVKFDVSVADLVKANGLDDDSAIIRIGQELRIPQTGVEVAAVTATSLPTPKTTSTPKATEAAATATITITATPAVTPTEEATIAPTATTAPTVAPTPTPEPATASISGKIAYPAYSTDINSFNVWLANIDGSNPQIIAGNASQPQYDPTGTLLAYRSWARDKRGIFYIDYTGGRQGLLTTFIEDSLPAWYTDGTLVFTSRREGDRVPRLFRVGQDAGDGYGLGFNSDYVDTLADNRLVARGCTPSGDCGLWTLLPGGGGETKISSETSDTAPAGHPQGGRIAIMSSGREQTGNWEIWTINEDGSDPVRLTENPANDGLPAWSPDGTSIAFVSDRGGVWAIWVMNADGTDQRKLFDMQGAPDGQVLHDVDNSKGWLEERITWIP